MKRVMPVKTNKIVFLTFVTKNNLEFAYNNLLKIPEHIFVHWIYSDDIDVSKYKNINRLILTKIKFNGLPITDFNNRKSTFNLITSILLAAEKPLQCLIVANNDIDVSTINFNFFINPIKSGAKFVIKDNDINVYSLSRYIINSLIINSNDIVSNDPVSTNAHKIIFNWFKKF